MSPQKGLAHRLEDPLVARDSASDESMRDGAGDRDPACRAERGRKEASGEVLKSLPRWLGRGKKSAEGSRPQRLAVMRQQTLGASWQELMRGTSAVSGRAVS